jgi:hypothetical protein
MGVGRRNNNFFGVQEGAVMTSGEYFQRGVRQGLHVGHKVQKKVHRNRLGPSEKKKRNSLLSPSVKKNTFQFQLELTLHTA